MQTKLLIIGLFVITLILIFAAMFSGKAHACPWWGCSASSLAYLTEQAQIDSNQQKLDTVQPLPQMTDSLERKNLIKRAKTFNNPNKISYIYLYNFGKLIMYDTVKGKVSALDSSLTPQKQFVDSGGKLISDQNTCIGNTDNCYEIAAPAVDGSYGTNGQGIFYYNENGAYREWNGEYVLSDQPFTPANPPDLVKQAK